jgi:glycosyltransferase 2 family protein
LGLLVLTALIALLVWARGRIHFDFALFRTQLALANWPRIALATGCIYLGYAFRSVRWELLLRHNKKVPLLSLLGAQVIGFTAVALIGRIADPVRPYLVAKKTNLSLSGQFAVYLVERLFDAGSMALIFSSAIVLTAWFGQPGALPHPEIVRKAGYWGMALTILGASFLFCVRLAGTSVASILESAFGLASRRLGHAVGHKVRSFHAGLDIMRTFSDFGVVASLSVGMWLLIAFAYLETMRAFTASPALAGMTWAKCVLLLAVSGVTSVFQLPVLGWFTQIGVVAAALATLFGASAESSTACAATLLLVTFLSIIPIGLVWARFEHLSMRRITMESEVASEELPAEEVF